MRLLLRSLGSPVPQEVTADAEDSVGDLLSKLGHAAALPEGLSHKLVYRGRLLRDHAARLGSVCCEGDTLVVLAGREPPPAPPAAQTSRGPSLREINAAIREDLAAQGPGALEAAEAAAAREQRTAAAQRVPGTQLLEQAMMTGEMGALLRQLQEAVRGGAGAGDDLGGGAGAVGDEAGMPLAAALDAFFGSMAQQLVGGAGGGIGAAAAAAAGAVGGDELLGSDEEGGEEGLDEFDSEEEEEEEDEEGEGYFHEEEEDEDEEDEEDDHSEGERGALPPVQVPVLDAQALSGLMEMGFSEARCRNALLHGRNRFEPALEWLLAHADDPSAEQPLSEAQLARLFGRAGPRRRAGGPQLDQAALSQLLEMGFDQQQAEQALRTFNNSLPAAASWLLNLGGLAGLALGGGAAAAAAAPPAPAAAAAQQPAAAAAAQQPAAAAPDAAAEVQGGTDGLPALESDSGGSDDGSGSDGGSEAGDAGGGPPGLMSAADN